MSATTGTAGSAGSTGWGGRIFLSYRREDTAYPAGWLCDRLAEHFGTDQVFKDVDSIALGDDYVDAIARAVGSCDVLLALIGGRWLSAADDEGRRRLDAPDDLVRIEIEAALGRHVKVIPVLVDGARMPEAEELPGSIAALVRRQALELSPQRFDYDTSRLITVLDGTVAEMRMPAPDRSGTPRPARSEASAVSTAERVRMVPGQRRSADPAPAGGAASTTTRPPGEIAAPGVEARAGWLVAGLLVVAVLLLVLARTAVLPAVSAGRPHQPQLTGWLSLLWLLPAAPALRAAWIVARDRRVLFGSAFGYIAAATVWVADSWAVMEYRDVWEPPRLVHVVLLLVLAAAGAFLVVLDPALRRLVAANRWSRASAALLLLAVAVLLRVFAGALADVLNGSGDPVTLGPGPGNGVFWVNEVVPFVAVAAAALLLVNGQQASALRTFVGLQVLFDLLIHVTAAAVKLQSDQLPVGDALYVVGSLVLLWACRVGQPSRAER